MSDEAGRNLLGLLVLALACLAAACRTATEPVAGGEGMTGLLLRSSGDADPEIRDLAVRIFHLYEDLFGVDGSTALPLTISLAGDGEYESSDFPALYRTSTRTIFFRGRPDCMLLLHEIAHHFILLRLGEVPPWLAEGLATYLGWSALDADGLLIGEVPVAHLKTLTRADQEDALLPLDRFSRITPEEFYDGAQSLRNYSQAWGLVFFLFHCHFPQPLSFREKADRLVAMDETALRAVEPAFRRFCREFSFVQMMTERLDFGPAMRRVSNAYRLGLLHDLAARGELLMLAEDGRALPLLRVVSLYAAALITVSEGGASGPLLLNRTVRRMCACEEEEVREPAKALFEAMGQGDLEAITDLYAGLSEGSYFYPARRFLSREE